MTNDDDSLINIQFAPEYFPATTLIESGLWADLTPPRNVSTEMRQP